MPERYAIYRADEMVEGGWEFRVDISAEQAALGAFDEETVHNLARLGGKLTDGEGALIIAHRADWTGLPARARRHDRARIARLKKEGLWPEMQG